MKARERGRKGERERESRGREKKKFKWRGKMDKDSADWELNKIEKCANQEFTHYLC